MAVIPPEEKTVEKKPPYICDFSDGEHGHELFSWQHRYYGSDASVHLGGNRSLRGTSSLKKSSKGYIVHSDPAHADVGLRLTNVFEKSTQKSSDLADSKNIEAAVAAFSDAYTKILSDLEQELKSVCISLNYVYAQKLVLHLLVSYNNKFTTSLFHSESTAMAPAGDDISRQLYRVIEQTASISTWLGEAGSMAVAAEALGLGISTFESNTDNPPPGMSMVGSEHMIIAGGISQFLSSAVLLENRRDIKNHGVYTPWTFVAVSIVLPVIQMNDCQVLVIQTFYMSF
jgi:hypothetical protein